MHIHLPVRVHPAGDQAIKKDWSLRKAPGRDTNAIIGRTLGFLMGIKEANAFAFNLPLERSEDLGKPFVTTKGRGLGIGLFLTTSTRPASMAKCDWTNSCRIR